MTTQLASKPATPTLEQAMNTLGPDYTKEILRHMWLSALTGNSQGKGNSRPTTVNGHTVPSFNSHVADPRVLNQLVDTSYQILAEHGFTRPDLWEHLIYDQQLIVAQVDSENPEGTHEKVTLTIADFINELREQRAEQYCKMLEHIPLPKNAKVADIGVGSGKNLLKFLTQPEHEGYQGYGLDPNYKPGTYPVQELVDLKDERGENRYTHSQDAKDFPNNLDIVMVGWVYHHAGNKAAENILQTAYEKLAPGGILFCMETTPSTSLTTDAENQDELAVAEAYFRDAVSSVGMLPGQTNNKVEITGHEHSEHWEQMIKDAGFVIVKLDHLSREADTFGETSARYVLMKPMESEQENTAILAGFLQDGATIPFHYDAPDR